MYSRYLTLLIIIGLVASIPPVSANAGVFKWFTPAKVGYQKPLTAFVGPSIEMDSWENTREKSRTEMQIVNRTALIATTNPITVKKMPTNPPLPPKAIHIIMATAYSSTLDQTDNTPFITAWGTRVRDGIIAANFLPFGTVVRIPDLFGEKVFVVEDRMHSRFPNRIDLWFPTREEALEFGAQRVKIEIIS